MFLNIMAFLKNKCCLLSFWLLVLLLLLVVMEEPSGGHNGQIRCLYPKETSPQLALDIIPGRKVLVASKGSKNNVDTEKVVMEELRTVPSGPDPLHHNGGNPKKPTTP